MQKASLISRKATAARKTSILIGALVAALAGLLFPSAAAATALPGKITENTTLTTAGSPYTGTSTIESGVTVKVEPGVELSGAILTIKGTLSVEGTAAKPVIFNNASAIGAAMTFEPGSGASVVNHAEVLKAGSEACCGNSKPAIKIRGSSPAITNSAISESRQAGIAVTEGGSPEIASDVIYKSKSHGIYYEAASKENTGEVNIQNNVIEGGGGRGISVSITGTGVSTKALSGNTIKGKESIALYYSGPDIPTGITENTLSGNEPNIIEVGGTVAHSSTWSNGGSQIKVREEGVTVASGITLSIGQGVYLTTPKFIVKGTLNVEGTSEKPVVFNGSGSIASSMIFEPGSGSSVVNYAEVLKAGNEGCCGNVSPSIKIKKSSPAITNSTITEARWAAISVSEGGSPEIAHDHIYKSKSSSLIYEAGEANTGEVNIHDNLVESGGGAGISITIKGTGVNAKALSGNTITGNKGVGLFYSGPDIPGGITENTLSGNETNIIEIGGTVAHSSTWSNGGTPIKVREEGVTVAAGVTLKITKGVYFTASRFIVKGTLNVEGTAAEPVVLNAAGIYSSMAFESGSGSSVVNYAQVIKAGNEACCGNSSPAIKIKKSSPTITNSTISESRWAAITVSEGGSPEIANNQILKSKGPAIFYSAASGNAGNVNIHGNYIEAGSSGISVEAANASVTASTLSGNTVLGTSGIGILYLGPEIPGDITENTLSGNASNIIEISGTVAKSSTWNNGNAPIKVREEGVTVASTVTLKITHGVYFAAARFIVKGTLNVEGTSADPVVFNPANISSGITFEPGSGSSVVNYAEIIKVGHEGCCGNVSPAIKIKKASPTITNSTIRESSAPAIEVTESGSPRIEWNRFRKNTRGLVYSGTGELSAPNNDWGCASGPAPAGCGDSVTAVKWKPAVQLPELAGHCRGKESQCGEGADPVSLATGQLNYSHRDLLLTNKSNMPLDFTRAYYSGSSSDTGLGPGWSQTGLASATELESGEVLILREDGRQDLFQKTESGYKAPSGVTDTLTKVEGTFQLTTLQNSVYRFDSSGRIASVTDDHGLKTTYGYDVNGRLATITDPSAQTLTFSYNGSNHITLVKDSTGREVKFAYSAAGDLETVTDALGGVTKYAYDAQHRLTSITDPRSNVILKNTYNGEGKITEQEDGLGHLWKLEYKPSETIVTEPEGGKEKYGFDGQDRVVSETDQLGHTTTTSYDEAGNVREVIQPGGAKWAYGHNTAGNLTSVKDPEGGELEYEYNAQNRPITFTDARGNAWSYEWSKGGDLEKITDPQSGETTFTYNESGQPLSETDPNEHKTEFGYDTRGNRTSETDPLGHKTSFEYNSRNYLTAKTLPGLKAEKLERDALGDLLSRTTPEGHTTKYEYDKNGLPVQITDPGENVWKIERNAMERPTIYTDPLEGQIKVSYNGDLQPTKVVDRRGRETTYGFNLANELTEVDRPEGEDWHYGYDARGNRTSIVDPLEHETTYEYDLLNRMTKTSEPLSITTEYGYDANGDLTSVKDPRGNTTSYGYDKLGRLTEVDQPLEETTTYTYDLAGNPLTKTTAAGTLNYGYDADNHLTEVKAGESTLRALEYNADNLLSSATDAEGHKIEVGYNEDSLVSSIKDGRGQSVARTYNSRGELTKQEDGRGSIAYEYDKLGRLTSLTDPQGKALGFGYDPEGDLAEVTRPNGVTTTNVFNEAGRLAETTSVEGGEPPTTLESLKYGYDPAGKVTSKLDQRLEAETTYAYDALNRLTEFNPPGEGATSYGYDKAGNRTEAGGVTYAFNTLNQLTESSTGTTYSYDGAGRMISKANGSEETSYEWNLLDHLAKVEGPTETTSYAYDGLERLSERKGSGGARVVHYGDLSDMPTYIANGEGEVTSSYVQGEHGLLEQRSGEATSYPLADGHGDVTAITGATGGVESRQEYGPWGERLSGPGLEMGYLGAWERPSDPATGLIQMGARTYDPSLGSFASEDPMLGHLGLGESVDRYLYVRDNPLGAYDLNGRDFCVLGACAGEAAEDIGNAGKSTAESAWNAGGEAANGIGSGAESAFNAGVNYANHVASFWSNRYQDFVKNLKESCGTSFGQRALDNFLVTNKAVPGLVAPTLSGAVVNRFGGVAESQGTLTAFDWAKNSRNISELPSVARAAGTSWIYASLAWEAGVGIGSLARSGLTALYC